MSAICADVMVFVCNGACKIVCPYLLSSSLTLFMCVEVLPFTFRFECPLPVHRGGMLRQDCDASLTTSLAAQWRAFPSHLIMARLRLLHVFKWRNCKRGGSVSNRGVVCLNVLLRPAGRWWNRFFNRFVEVWWTCYLYCFGRECAWARASFFDSDMSASAR